MQEYRQKKETLPSWLPSPNTCTLDGDVRSMEMAGVGTVQERILKRDADAMLLEYGLINRHAKCAGCTQQAG